ECRLLHVVLLSNHLKLDRRAWAALLLRQGTKRLSEPTRAEREPLRWLRAEREPEAPLGSSLDLVENAGPDEHPAAQRLVEHPFRIEASRKRKPEHQPSLGTLPLHPGQEMACEPLFERVAPQAIFGQGLVQMRAQVPALEKLGEHVLQKERSSQ